MSATQGTPNSNGNGDTNSTGTGESGSSGMKKRRIFGSNGTGTKKGKKSSTIVRIVRVLPNSVHQVLLPGLAGDAPADQTVHMAVIMMDGYGESLAVHPFFNRNAPNNATMLENSRLVTHVFNPIRDGVQIMNHCGYPIRGLVIFIDAETTEQQLRDYVTGELIPLLYTTDQPLPRDHPVVFCEHEGYGEVPCMTDILTWHLSQLAMRLEFVPRDFRSVDALFKHDLDFLYSVFAPGHVNMEFTRTNNLTEANVLPEDNGAVFRAAPPQDIPAQVQVVIPAAQAPVRAVNNQVQPAADGAPHAANGANLPAAVTLSLFVIVDTPPPTLPFFRSGDPWYSTFRTLAIGLCLSACRHHLAGSASNHSSCVLVAVWRVFWSSLFVGWLWIE